MHCVIDWIQYHLKNLIFCDCWLICLDLERVNCRIPLQSNKIELNSLASDKVLEVTPYKMYPNKHHVTMESKYTEDVEYVAH
jgi:hypothetical protein